MAAENNWCSGNCPVDCDDVLVTVPELGCEAPNNDNVTEIFWSNDPLVSGLLSEWNARLSNSASATNGIIRSLVIVDGNLPRVEAAFKTSKKGAAIPLEVDRVMSFTSEDDKDTTFNFFSGFQCGMTKRFWLRSGGHIYGGLRGISGTLVSSYEINSESELMAHNWALQLRFKSKCFPTRTAAVI